MSLGLPEILIVSSSCVDALVTGRCEFPRLSSNVWDRPNDVEGMMKLGAFPLRSKYMDKTYCGAHGI